MIKNNRRGALLGLAVGDALGASVEFSLPGEFPPFRRGETYRSGGPHNLAPGEWTDDTSLALALADSLSRGWNLHDQATQYLRWMDKGAYSVNGECFDIGTTTLSALRWFRTHHDPLTSGLAAGCGPGNGSIMRLAPVALVYEGRELWEKAELSSLPTHGDLRCRSACRVLGYLLGELIAGRSLMQLNPPEEAFFRGLHPKILEMLDSHEGGLHIKFTTSPSGLAIRRDWEVGRGKGSGFVVDSLQSAIECFVNSCTFEDAVLQAVNLGNDSDTTAAITGALAGAYYGEGGIPQRWLKALARRDMIEEALTKLNLGK